VQQQINVSLIGALMVCPQAIRHCPAHGGTMINLSALNSKKQQAWFRTLGGDQRRGRYPDPEISARTGCQ